MRESVRWKTPWLPDGNDPTSIPIIALLFYEFGFIAWVFGFLIVAVATELGATDLAAMDRRLYPVVGFFGGALPIFAAYAISTNRRFAAHLTMLAIIGILFCVGAMVNGVGASRVFQCVTLGLAVAFTAFSGWVIFLSRKYRSRWRRWQKSQPDRRPGVWSRITAILRRWDVMSFLEHLVLLLALGVLIGSVMLAQYFR